ncbi:hypothetical protein [Actinomadura violacea]|uniref:Uncharacterized protein n=1 Tax=Actinomadura violacea TaxID=2819934 RepID=A0ABS3RXK9_9ACTN|nr:hypothetical protein [Actinomadura violacea]MBO2461495.1 hypothetical protein [Actinomadura violacea]
MTITDDTKYAIFSDDTDEQLAGPMDYWTAVDWVVEHREEFPDVPVTARVVETRDG